MQNFWKLLQGVWFTPTQNASATAWQASRHDEQLYALID